VPKIQKLKSKIKNPRESDIEWSNLVETQLHSSLATLKTLMLKIYTVIIKKQEPHLMQELLHVYHPPTKGKRK
jgi:hypothetical protein